MLDILKACHDEPCGGHFVDKRKLYKVLNLGYYWPSIFKYSKTYANKCDICQKIGRPVHYDETHLKTQVLVEPFEQWDFEFVGPINPSSNGKRYILVCIDYVTKWVEEKAMTKATANAMVFFF